MNLLLPMVAVLLWSINTIVSKLSAGSIDPAAISFYCWRCWCSRYSACRAYGAIFTPSKPSCGDY